MRNAVSKRAAGEDKVEIELSVRRVVRIERHPKQPLLAVRVQTGQGKKRIRVQCSRREIENPDYPVLLHNKEPPEIAGRSSDKNRLRQTRCDPDSGNARKRLRPERGVGQGREDQAAEDGAQSSAHHLSRTFPHHFSLMFTSVNASRAALGRN